MRSALDCLPCFVRQALTAARATGDDPELHEAAARAALEVLRTQDLSVPPPAVAQRLHRRIRELTSAADPYAEAKAHANETMLRLLPALERRVREADDPFAAAVHLAIAGNAIDAGVGDADVHRVEELLEAALERPLTGDLDAFRRDIAAAADILYLLDNTGEVVVDRLLAEHLPLDRLTFVVRGGPVLNDATAEDAELAGLTQLAPVIDNGSDGPGTILSDCSAAFQRRFEAADLIIAKGQGNFETLSDARPGIVFLFMVKCPVVATHTGLERGSLVVLRSPDDGHPPTGAT